MSPPRLHSGFTKHNRFNHPDSAMTFPLCDAKIAQTTGSIEHGGSHAKAQGGQEFQGRSQYKHKEEDQRNPPEQRSGRFRCAEGGRADARAVASLARADREVQLPHPGDATPRHTMRASTDSGRPSTSHSTNSGYPGPIGPPRS